MITLRLTLVEAKVLFNTVDGASDAGACAGGNTKQEQEAMGEIMRKLEKQRPKWVAVKLDTDWQR